MALNFSWRKKLSGSAANLIFYFARSTSKNVLNLNLNLNLILIKTESNLAFRQVVFKL